MIINIFDGALPLLTLLTKRIDHRGSQRETNRVCSFRRIQKQIFDIKTDLAFFSVNPNSGESFFRKDSLDLKSKESKSRFPDL